MTMVFDGTLGLTNPGNLTVSGGNIITPSTLTIQTGGTPAVTVNASQQVGIVTTPRQQLSVGATLDLYSGGTATTSVPSIRGSGANNLVLNGYSSGGVYFNYDTGSDGVYFCNGSLTAVAKVTSGGIFTRPNHPTFYAYGAAGSGYSSGSYWVFPTTTVNYGNYYNTSTGVFTAPVAGAYQFWWTNLASNAAKDVYRYFIYYNNAQVGNGIHLRMDLTGESILAYGTNGVMSCILPMSVNDTARIYYSSDGNNASYPSGSGNTTNNYPAFSGTLVG